jgi:hypothetical protein
MRSHISLKRQSPKEESDRVALVELATRLDAIDTDYHDLRAAVVGLGKRIDDLGSSINAKIDQRAQPQWQTYIAGAMLLGGMFFAFISPIQRTQDDLRTAILKVDTDHHTFEKEMATAFTNRNSLFVSVREHDEFKKRIDDKIDRTSVQLDKIDGMIVRLLTDKK